MRHRRRGFTLLELLVVIGIILLLMGMVVVGYRAIDNSVAKRATATFLNTDQSLLAEFDATGGGMNTLGTRIPGFPFPGGAGGPIGLTTKWTIADVNPGSNDRVPLNGNYITYTQSIMLQLTSQPQNKQVVSQLPAKQLLTNSQGGTVNGPILLDGWKNPIIFVPRGGIIVKLKSGTGNPAGNNYIVRSSGVYDANSPPLIKTNDRPFWASAGQDGDFTTGDDNVYSFQNQ